MYRRVDFEVTRLWVGHIYLDCILHSILFIEEIIISIFNEMYGFLEVHRKYKTCKTKKFVHIFICIVAISKFPQLFMSGKGLVQQFSPT